MTPILTVRNLSTGYCKPSLRDAEGSGRQKQVLFNVSLDVMPGEILLITDCNGSGKPSPRDAEGSGRQSTLLKAIYGLLPAWNADAEIVFRPNPDGPALSTQSATHTLRNGLAFGYMNG